MQNFMKNSQVLEKSRKFNCFFKKIIKMNLFVIMIKKIKKSEKMLVKFYKNHENWPLLKKSQKEIICDNDLEKLKIIKYAKFYEKWSSFRKIKKI